MYIECIKSLGIGIIIGGIFTFCKLPIPAPINISAIFGIIGIYLGYIIIKGVIK